MNEQVFRMIPASSGIQWFLVPALLLTLSAAAYIGYTMYSSRRVVYTVTPAGLEISGDVYARTVARSELLLEKARAVDLEVDSELEPVVRTNGTGLPGYKAGWFRLSNGEKALLFVTDQSRVAYVPTRAGYSILMSVEDPAAFVRALQTSAPR